MHICIYFCDRASLVSIFASATKVTSLNVMCVCAVLLCLSLSFSPYLWTSPSLCLSLSLRHPPSIFLSLFRLKDIYMCTCVCVRPYIRMYVCRYMPLRQNERMNERSNERKKE